MNEYSRRRSPLPNFPFLAASGSVARGLTPRKKPRYFTAGFLTRKHLTGAMQIVRLPNRANLCDRALLPCPLQSLPVNLASPRPRVGQANPPSGNGTSLEFQPSRAEIFSASSSVGWGEHSALQRQCSHPPAQRLTEIDARHQCDVLQTRFFLMATSHAARNSETIPNIVV